MADNSNPQAGQGRQLPKKEQDIFRNVVKFYEGKQYKKSIKQADLILKKFLNHGETLAMKGLALNGLSKRDEAHELVKLGLRNDMRSHVCWHVYGLLYRSDRNYNEAIKAYKQALRIDNNNIQILRDLSLLQIQMRDLDGFHATRLKLLELKSNHKINWISLALAKQVTGDLEGAVAVIDAYLGTLAQGSPELERGFESSELALYRNVIIADIPNNFQAALAHLSKIENIVVDRGAWLLAKARYEVHLEQFQEARETLVLMMERGVTDDYRVHSAYMCALLELDGDTFDKAMKIKGTDTIATTTKLMEDQKKLLLETYQHGMRSKFPKSQAVHRIPLTLLEGEAFLSGINEYCRKRLSKGVPSLSSDLSAFLLEDKGENLVRVKDPADVKKHPLFVLFVNLADGYMSNLASSSTFSPQDEKEEPPSTLLWAWFLRAGLHELAGEYSEGIVLLDQCLEHTPTAVDVYEMKARLLKEAGDIKAAVDAVDKGRDLDKQDRYINNLTTKYMLQAGMPELALERIALFTKHEGNPEDNLFNMQCSWYELELADCFARKKIWGKSLKKYSAVVKHFDDFHEDQFDFHSYCVRKVTLRAYSDLLKFEDSLLGDEYYGRAAEGIIRIYLHLHDNPLSRDNDENVDYSKMTPAQRKKAKAIARKKKHAAEKKAAEEAEKKKAAEEAAAAADNENGRKKKQGNTAAIVDEDPDGLELLKKTPLEEAKKFSNTLSLHAPKRLSTWIFQYDVAIRRNKGLLALQALFKARAIDSRSGELLTRIVDFALKLDKIKGSNPIVSEVITSQVKLLMENKSLEEFVTSAADTAKVDGLITLSSRTAVAKALVVTKLKSGADAANLILDGELSCRGVSVASCREALATLKEMDSGTDAISKWVSIVKTKFPLIQDFE